MHPGKNKNIDSLASAAPWTMHEFFAGSGLVACGLKGMFAPVWANDISEQKAAIYTANLGAEHFVLGDIKSVRGKDVPYAHMSWASFPCQDLSLAGRMGGIHAARSGMVWEWLRVLDEMDNPPKILALENVAGLLSSHGGENYRALHLALVDRGYDCGAILLNASHFVPQSRLRVFVIAVRHGCPIPSELISDSPCWLHNSAAISVGNTLPNWIWWQTAKPARRKISLEDIIEKDAKFDRDNVLSIIPQRHIDILNERETVFATAYRRTRQGNVQLEVRFDGVAGCLRTPEGGSSKQYFIMKQNGEIHARLLTVRETARLMGAPDDFQLPGTYNDGYKAMGDAVAMPVAKFIGERFLAPLAEEVY